MPSPASGSEPSTWGRPRPEADLDGEAVSSAGHGAAPARGANRAGATGGGLPPVARDASAGVLGALVAAGAATLLTQASLLRELLAHFQGNELTLGLAFGAWLALTALMAALVGRLVATAQGARHLLGLLLGAAPVLLWSALWLTRLARPGGLLVGEEPGPLAGLAGALVSLMPACLMAGGAYALGVVALGASDGPPVDRLAAAGAARATRAYLAETVGAVAAGAAFHFVLGEHLAAPWVVAVAGALCAASGTWLLAPRRPALRLSLSLAAPMAVVGVAVLVAPWLKANLLASRFPSAQVVASWPSRYGQLTTTRHHDQQAFFHDGVLLFTSQDEVAAEERVHLPLLLHPQPRRVLLLGGGLGGGVAEALKHRPTSVDAVELDPALFALVRAYATPRALSLLDDPRVRLRDGDGRQLLRQRAGAYDVIIVTLPEPQSALLSRFYSVECFREARRALAPGGLLALSIAGAESYLDPPTARKHAVLWRTLGEVFPVRGAAPGGRAIIWAATHEVPHEPQLLARRIGERRLDLTQVGPTWLADRLLSLNVDDYLAAIGAAAAPAASPAADAAIGAAAAPAASPAADAAFGATAARAPASQETAPAGAPPGPGAPLRDQVPVRVSTDLRPVVYLYGLLEQLRRAWPRGAAVAQRAAEAPWAPWLLWAALLLPVAVVLVRRRAHGSPEFAALATGATSMGLQITLLLGFQSLCGHLYHALGGLAAAFMVGLSVGALVGLRLARCRHGLAWACAGVLSAALAVRLALSGAAGWAAGGSLVLVALSVVVGAATGAVYAPAVAATRRRREAAGARIYAWDLAGAAAGALVCSLVTVPLFGLPATTWAAAVMGASALVASLGAESLGAESR